MKIKRFNEEFDFDEEDFDMEEYNVNINNTITHVNYGDDFEGLYINNKLITEGDSIELRTVLVYLIDNNIQMGNYTYKNLQYWKNGQYEDWVNEDEWYSIEEKRNSLTDFIQGCMELGYEIKLK